MSIYHLTISNVSRASGSSSCASLSYITAEKVHEDRTGQNYNYGSRKERVIAKDTFLPAEAPEQYKNPATLFNDLETFEKAENARTAKKIEVALPREFDLEKQKQVVENYIKDNITSNGYACSYAIHCDKDGNNPHCHILVANRPLVQGQWAIKDKKVYQLDSDGNRIPVLDPNTGVQKIGAKGRKMWKRVSISPNLMDSKDYLQTLRKNWAVECNKHLDPAHQIDHRSYEEQGIDRLPTVHEGYAAKRLEALGHISERSELNRRIRAINAEKAELEKEKREYARLSSEVTSLENQLEKEQENLVKKQQSVAKPQEKLVKNQQNVASLQNVNRSEIKQEKVSPSEIPSVSPQNVPESILRSDDYRILQREIKSHSERIESYEKDIKTYEAQLVKLDKREKYIRAEMEKFNKQGGLTGFLKRAVFDLEPAKLELKDIKKAKGEITSKLEISKTLLEREKANKQIYDKSLKDLVTGKREVRSIHPSPAHTQEKTKTREKTRSQGKSRIMRR